MKINEVIVEAVNQNTGTPNAEPAQPQQPTQKKPGLWNKLKQGIAGARAGMQQARDTRAVSQGLGARANQANIQLELDSFNRYLSQALAGQPVTPQILQATAKKFVDSRYPSADPTIVSNVAGIKDLKSASAYISQSYNSAMTNRATATPAAPQSTPKAAQAKQQTSVGGIEVPFSAGAGPRKTQATVDPEQAQQQAMAQGISVVSNEPIILRNKAGKEFGLNDNGQWIHLSSGKIPAEAYQAFLSQQHDISLGLQK